MLIKRCVFSAVAAVAMATCPATADTISMTFDSLVGEGVGFHYIGDRGTTGDFHGSTTAGRFGWTVTAAGAGSAFSPGDTVTTFCTELTQYISPGGTYDYTCMSPSDLPTHGGFEVGEDRAGLIADLFEHHYETAATGTPLEAAAFQVSLWEIVYEDDVDDITTASSATSGDFYISGNTDVTDLASVWLDDLVGGDVPGWLVGFGSRSNQDQLSMIPLPAPFGLAAVGLLGVIVGRRKLRRSLE